MGEKENSSFFSLYGSPRSDEAAQLRAAIEQERAATAAAVRSRLAQLISLEEAAKANCADVRLSFAECLQNRSMLASMTSFCLAEKRRVDKCLESQSRFLHQLGFHKLPRNANYEERLALANKADQLYLRHISESNENEAATASEAKTT
ncbi:hypothetical protein HK100_009592 [Physocladia obscura]|uniref:Uncharacterized protein n=1 Tax=Physocladia obscura TaxID=109957 RepID=A0AAD5SMI8_9FUNG|nr:hypothetical protein HK100_009592 [Physocladia obscura]